MRRPAVWSPDRSTTLRVLQPLAIGWGATCDRSLPAPPAAVAHSADVATRARATLGATPAGSASSAMTISRRITTRSTFRWTTMSLTPVCWPRWWSALYARGPRDTRATRTVGQGHPGTTRGDRRCAHGSRDPPSSVGDAFALPGSGRSWLELTDGRAGERAGRTRPMGRRSPRGSMTTWPRWRYRSIRLRCQPPIAAGASTASTRS